MSENLLKILAAELTTLRITCLNEECGTVIEMPIDRIREESSKEIVCPLCQAKIRSRQGTDTLSKLATAIDELKAVKGVEVSFILRQGTGKE